MEQKSITLKRGQVKGIYEYFASQLQQEGKTAEFSYLIYKNAETLAQEYANIVNTIYDENRDIKYKTFMQEDQALLIKYADRDEQGNPITTENGGFKITEQLAEYKQELQKHYDDNKAMLEEREQKIKESVQFLNVPVEFNLLVMPVSHFPDTTAPVIVGTFAVV